MSPPHYICGVWDVHARQPAVSKWLSLWALSAIIGIIGSLGSLWLQKQAPSLAVLYCSRKEFSPLGRKSNSREGLQARCRRSSTRMGAAFAPTRDLVILHAWIALQQPLGCHSVRPIYEWHNRFNFEISLPFPPPFIFAEMDLQWKYLKRNNYLYEQQQHNACRRGVGQQEKRVLEPEISVCTCLRVCGAGCL